MSTKANKVADLNDIFRKQLLTSLAGGHVDGKYHITAGLQVALAPADLIQLFKHVANFDQFTPENDPHDEHDFGSLEHAGENIYWKIDYYDKESLSGGEEYASEDPSNPEITTRVMTIMLARDY